MKKKIIIGLISMIGLISLMTSAIAVYPNSIESKDDLRAFAKNFIGTKSDFISTAAYTCKEGTNTTALPPYKNMTAQKVAFYSYTYYPYWDKYDLERISCNQRVRYCTLKTVTFMNKSATFCSGATTMVVSNAWFVDMTKSASDYMYRYSNYYIPNKFVSNATFPLVA